MEGTEYAERIVPIFARLNVLMTYLKTLDVKRKVYINPLSSLNDKFYRGSVLFQCAFDGKRRDVFAAGGRYDHLIQEFSPKVLSSRPRAHAVGFNLSLDRLASSITDYVKAKAPSKDAETGAELYWTARRVSIFSSQLGSLLTKSKQCDVLVASFDATVLRTTGVKLIEELWTNDISAELAVDASSLEELLAKYKDHNHRWIVIAKQDSKERGFKVRNLVRKEEFDIRSSELVLWLRTEVQARHPREGTVDPRQSRLPGQQDALAPQEKANDVRILVPQHRSKKTNRRNIVESGMFLYLP